MLIALRTSFCSDLYYLEVGHPACGAPRSSCTYFDVRQATLVAICHEI